MAVPAIDLTRWPLPQRLVATLALCAVASGAFRFISSWQEAIGAGTGAVCVWMAAKSDPWTWPVSIVNNLLYLAIFWQAHLFAESLLQLVFLISALYGIWRWRNPQADTAVRPVTRTPAGEFAAVAGGGVAATLLIHWLLVAGSPSTTPWPDSVATSLSLCGQWLLSRRMIENWGFWIAANLVSIPLYLFKELHATALLYSIFLTLCFVGVRDWRRELKASREAG
jgi:nicotinamide mononucleotide transporter